MADERATHDTGEQEPAGVPAVPGNAYHFMTKKQIRERILADRGFAADCVALIQARHERRQAGTHESGPCGWMSSHASVGPRLAAKVADGTATEEELDRALAMVARYSKQIAVELRALALQRRPELAATAALFGVSASGAGVAPTAGGQEQPARTHGRRQSAASPLADTEPPAEAEEPEGSCEVCASVMALLRAEDGQRSTDIAEALDTTTVELAKHLRDLLDAGSLTKEGHGRGTRYYVA